MTKPKTIAGLGPIVQLAYVPSDWDATLRYWTETMGVGPFFLFEKLQLEGMKFKGEPNDAAFTLAIAYWGDVQIELVRAENDAPAHYNGEYAVHDRLNHVLILVDDFAEAERVVADAGAEVVVSGKFGGGEVMYVDPGAGPGSLVEILKPGPGGMDMFDMMKAAAQDWDGSDPIRTL